MAAEIPPSTVVPVAGPGGRVPATRFQLSQANVVPRRCASTGRHEWPVGKRCLPIFWRPGHGETGSHNRRPPPAGLGINTPEFIQDVGLSAMRELDVRKLPFGRLPIAEFKPALRGEKVAFVGLVH